MSNNFYDREDQFQPQPYQNDGHTPVYNENVHSDNFQSTNLKPKSIALRMALWTWVAIAATYVLMLIVSPFIGIGVLLFLIFGVYGSLVAFAITVITAIVELIRKKPWLPSLIAILLSFPIIFAVKLLGF